MEENRMFTNMLKLGWGIFDLPQVKTNNLISSLKILIQLVTLTTKERKVKSYQ